MGPVWVCLAWSIKPPIHMMIPVLQPHKHNHYSPARSAADVAAAQRSEMHLLVSCNFWRLISSAQEGLSAVRAVVAAPVLHVRIKPNAVT